MANQQLTTNNQQLTTDTYTIVKFRFGQKLREELTIWRAGALPGIMVITLVVIARLTGSLQFLEWIAFDRFLRWRPVEPIDQQVVIVGINEADIRRVGYPIADRDIANLLNKLQTYQPVVIGLDIFKDLPIQPGHTELTKTFQTYQNIIAIDKVLPDQSGMTVNPPPSLPPEQVGFADAIFDSDGYLRRSLLGTVNAEGEYRFSLTLRLAETYLASKGIPLDNGIRDPAAMRFGNTELTRFQPNFGGYVGADAGGNQILLNFRSGKQSFQTFSLQESLGKLIQSGCGARLYWWGLLRPASKM
jgi:CHASE2 domain-containing sensor protein